MNTEMSIRVALENHRRSIVVTKEAAESGRARSRILSIEKRANAALDLFKRDASDSLFLGRMPEKTEDMGREYDLLKDIAISFGSVGTEHYMREDVLDVLLFSLEWMYENRYGYKEIRGDGWRDMRLFNWWHWEIGVPTALMDILTVLSDEISSSEAKKYLSVFDKRVPVPRDYGANKIHYAILCTLAGLLEEDADRIKLALDSIEDTYSFSDGWKNDGQGFYTDGSYIFHTRHPMNGTYGIGHLKATVELCMLLRGTAFARKEIEEKILFWAENSFLPFVSRCFAARGIMGRHPSGCDISGLSILSGIAEACDLMMNTDREKCEYLLDIVARNLLMNPERCTNEGIERFVSGLTDGTADAVLSAIERAKKQGIRDYSFSRVFHNEERAVHHFGNVAYALSMSSSRIYNYECINHENMKGWYLGDGMLTCLGSDVSAYKNVWDRIDPYRLPGTTLDSREREEISISQRNEYLSSQDFVGGVTGENAIAAAMVLESYHGSGEHIDKKYFSPDGLYGGPPAKRECTLTAKKAYFIDGKIALMLGTDIRANDGAPVYTVVDSRQSCGRLLDAEGKEIRLSDEDMNIQSGALFLEGFGGYMIKGGRVLARRGGEDKSFTEIIIDHGTNPSGQGYAYALLPEYTREELSDLSKNPPFEIISNTPALQAIKFSSGARMLVFYEKGECEGVSVSAPVIAMIKNGTLYVSDPTQKLCSADITIDGRVYKANFQNTYGATLSFSLDK